MPGEVSIGPSNDCLEQSAVSLKFIIFVAILVKLP